MDARTETAGAAGQAAAAPTPAKPNNGRRNQLFTILGAVIVVAAVIYFLYWLLVASHHVGTDDAYINADVALVTPQVAGSIIAAPTLCNSSQISSQISTLSECPMTLAMIGTSNSAVARRTSSFPSLSERR